ncbi:FAD-binding oxidoreductase [Chryseobacterium taichungense]|uniref:FAD-binding oxidoreductase n=1 Tax=Chryseobacterium taichungense TaxID=295069 RepID=UPI0028A7493B|nr:FAD-binding oxidoreductase [Chryseobacterium taichungense]
MISKLPKWAADLTEKTSSIMTDMKILETVYITPNVKKIRFQGDISRMNFQIGHANVIRVSDTEFRNYTTSYYNVDEGVLDIIFHIHGNGVGSQYIDSLKPLDELRISIPRGKKMYNENIQQQFIFGDETSLGLACSMLTILKKNKHQYQFYFELDDENQNIPELLGLENYTVFSKKNTFRDEEWINELPIFNSDEWNTANFILTGNVKSVQTFRKVLKDNSRNNISSQGYWLEGKKGL